MCQGNAGAPSLSHRLGKKKKRKVGSKNKRRRSAPRGVTKSAKETPASVTKSSVKETPVSKHTLAPEKVTFKKEEDASFIASSIGGEDDALSDDPITYQHQRGS